ncbi:paraquat-inducible protein A [Sulfurimonas sp.]|uniref:paraquat-inducible protein A n=1 Tax=Sulfurimonas sp. TaxID=2022749 RepID=UPI002B4A3BB3|nr:paraquat-inducible protein A [Sulfurimonas sp.]
MYSKNLSSGILSVILVLIIAFMAFQAYLFSVKYDKEMASHAQNYKIENKIDHYIQKTNNIIQDYFSEYIRGETKEQKPHELSKINKENTQLYTTLYFIALGVLLLTYFFSSKEIFIVSILSAALISWFVGIFAPIMTVEIFKDLPIFGFTIFKYESKGIWSTVEKLWILQNYFLAVVITLFSIAIPIIKTISLYFSVLMKINIKYIDFITKWSMADVFIVSLLLTNLSLSVDEFTNAEVQIAVYFFCTYVVLSILSSYIIIKEREK